MNELKINRRLKRRLIQLTNVAMLALLVGSLAAPAQAGGGNGGWGPASPLLKMDGTQTPGGCPIESPGGLFIFTARNPSGSNIDIYVNQRAHPTAPLAPGNILPTIISDPNANDFCPTPLPDGVLYFVSNRMPESPDVACGQTDIYRSVDNPATGYSTPINAGCYPYGPNTEGTEFSPSIVKTRWGTFLFFSSDFPTGNQDIYMSYMRWNGTFTKGYRLPYPINTEFNDKQPNVSQDGREIVFASDRDSGDPDQSDIYYAKRAFLFASWRKVTNLSQSVPFDSAPADETRPSLSWDGERLIYGSGGVWQSDRRGHYGW